MKASYAIVLLAFMLGVALPARADDLTGTLKKIKESGVVTIGNRESSVPFSFLDANNKPAGYSIELCNYVAEQIKKTLNMPNLSVRFLTVSPVARIPLLTNGTIDMECSTTSISLSRMRQVGFSSPTFVVSARILTKANSGVKDWDDLRGRIIGVPQGTNSEKEVKALVETAAFRGTKVLTIPDQAAGLLALETDRVDGYVTDDIVLYGLRSSARSKDQLVVTGRPLTFETYAIMVPRGDPDFRLLVDGALSELYRSPDLDKIYQKWFAPLDIPMSEANRYMYKIGAITP